MSQPFKTTSSESLQQRIESLVSRYKKDLAYFLERLDNIEHALHEQQMLMCCMALLQSRDADNYGKKMDNAIQKTIARGNCKVIQFNSFIS